MVGDSGGFYGGAHVVYAEDVCPCEDGCGVGCGGGVQAVLRCEGFRCNHYLLSNGLGEEALARDSGEDRQIELTELVEMRQQREVFAEALAEAEAGVEHDLVDEDACSERGLQP